ncbi:MAG: metal ABC transporter permease [Caldilineaceae bacterium]
MQYLELLITSLLVVAIAIGLQAVGVVLMSAMVVAPAAAPVDAQAMVVLAALFGAMAGVGGTLLSSMGAGLSTGPVIVLAVSVITTASLLFAPSRGLVWRWVQQQRNRRRLRTDQVLGNLYTLAGQHDDLDHPHTEEALRIMGEGARGVSASLAALAERGLVRRVDATRWALTPAGVTVAREKFDTGDAASTGDGAAGGNAGTHTEAVQP